MWDLLTDAAASFFSSKGVVMNDWAHFGIEVAIIVIGGWILYLLKNKDSSQQKEINSFKEATNHDISESKKNVDQSFADLKNQITDLYNKHGNDADRLHALELDVARNFFTKEEINKEFAAQRKYLDDRFDRLEKLFFESRK
jgi:hypothetical protein